MSHFLSSGSLLNSTLNPSLLLMNQSSTNIWSHTVPNTMPWAGHVDLKNSINPVMRFTAAAAANESSLNPYGVPNFNCITSPDPCTSQTATAWELFHKLSSGAKSNNCTKHLKRRNSSDDEDEEDDAIHRPPAKQYISEERVAAKFNQLCISNQIQNNSSVKALNDTTDAVGSDDAVLDKEEVEELEEEVNGVSIVMSDEMQAAFKKLDPVDKVIREELEKPSKAVVLWQPPIGFLLPQVTAPGSAATSEEAQQEDNYITSRPSAFSSTMDLELMEEFNEMMDV